MLSIDLESTPFSAHGSYLAVSRDPVARGSGVWLRGLIRPEWGNGRKKPSDHLLRMLAVNGEGRFIPARLEACAHQLCYAWGERRLTLALEGLHTMLVSGGLGLVLEHDHDDNRTYQVQVREDAASLYYPAFRYQVRLQVVRGRCAYQAAGKRIMVLPDAAGELQLRIQAAPRELMPPCDTSPVDAEQAALAHRQAFERWLSVLQPAGETAELCAYLLWSGAYAPCGLIRARCCAISKQLMDMVWAWDNCFNALAVAPADPELALGNYLMLFRQQDEDGRLPDAVNPVCRVDWFTKPPVHGMLLRPLLRSLGQVEKELLEELYQGLARQTDWWYAHTLRDGLATYLHPYDSGWDNATCFDRPGPLAAPDLNAWLVAQQDCLADLAQALGDGGAAVRWRQRADALLRTLLERLWDGGRFGWLDAQGAWFTCDSLMRMMPLALGRRLPEAVAAALAEELAEENHFLTPCGLASESLHSPMYDHRHNEEITKPNAYWRGPVWAPPVYLACMGLADLGRAAQARELAARYCRTVERCPGAIYENYDAITGQGLDDTGYLWSASVYLLLQPLAEGR
ncbi:MAG: amylo-alpha-1,6-glucosidase [Aristaeellaceae bacterium]